MRLSAKRIAVTSTLVGMAPATWWMFFADGPADSLVDKANVVGALFGGAGLLVAAIVALWPQDQQDHQLISDDQLGASSDHLARVTLNYWRDQARIRGILAPVPAAVRWTWAAGDVAVPAKDLRLSKGRPFTQGEVTALRERLYMKLPDSRARLVILGAPGSGKTGAMLLLLIDVLENPEIDAVPVWLTLGSWNPRTPLLKWAESVLIRNYPSLVAAERGGRRVVRELLNAGKVAFFLDGLDEMPESHRSRALEAIDRESGSLRVVLTSRPAEYRHALQGGRIFGAAVVETLPLDPAQAREFLLREQLKERRSAWEEVIAQLKLRPDSVAARTMVTPLALSLARDTYSVAGDPRDLLDEKRFSTSEDLLAHLLERFLFQAYPEDHRRRHVIRWLGWLAHRMGSRRDLAWWLIPPALLVRRTPRALTRVQKAQSDEGAAQAKSLPPDQSPSDPAARRLNLATVFSIAALASIAVRVVSFQQINGIAFSQGPVGAACGVVIGALVGKILDSSSKIWTQPLADSPAVTSEEAYRSERRYEIQATLCCVAILALMGLSFGWFFALLFGSSCLLAYAYGPAVALWIMQASMFLRGHGWVDFMRLLGDAQDKQLLRQVGPVYQFRHAALQDYLKGGAREAGKWVR
ncbi:NACHT domain-containing protein [Actinoplanes sp. NPDC049681]|uniref:NACHT domain-containing protein n=1 Tax=Actinoplanes sp. NPDC049681 TaxID=3363905 RepID=UPI0037BA3ABF